MEIYYLKVLCGHKSEVKVSRGCLPQRPLSPTCRHHLLSVSSYGCTLCVLISSYKDSNHID
jgi:hypothetical protein